MQKVDLYRYEENGKVTITPNKQNETDTPSRMRLIADDGCVLVNGKTETIAVDVTFEEVDLWKEKGSADEATESDYISALEDLGVNFNG
jgi:hypothetical protein